MAANFGPNRPHFWVYLKCDEETFPRLVDVDGFLHDLNILYEISRVATDANYDNYPMSQLTVHRGDRLLVHIRDEDRLYMESISKQSPMELATVVFAVPAAVGAIWGMVQIFEKVVNFRLNRRKLREEVRKLEHENSHPNDRLTTNDDAENSAFLFENPSFLEARLRERGALEEYRAASERLLRSRISIVEVNIELRR
jgi:hypothetical protein